VSESPPSASVVIPTWNSQATLGRLLESLKLQTVRDFEVIVVDNLSSDSTASIAQVQGCNLISRRTNRSEARNLGGEAAKSECLLFLDCDMEASADLLKSCIAGLARADALSIREISYCGKNYLSRALALERDAYFRSTYYEFPRCFRKSAFAELSGYEASLTFREDIDLYARFRARDLRMGWVDEPIFHHVENLTFTDFVRKARMYATANRAYASRDPTFWSIQRSVAKRGAFVLREAQSRPLSESVGLLPGLVFARGLEFILTLPGLERVAARNRSA
jgi:glycosyltransferase involved in cell wall biosynthesis